MVILGLKTASMVPYPIQEGPRTPSIMNSTDRLP